MSTGFQKIIRKITNFQCYFGMILLAVLMFLGAFDVIGRYFFNSPIKGAYEVSEVLLAALVFFGLAHTVSVRGHVSVDSFVSRFRPRARACIGIVLSLISMIIFKR